MHTARALPRSGEIASLDHMQLGRRTALAHLEHMRLPPPAARSRAPARMFITSVSTRAVRARSGIVSVIGPRPLI